MKRSDRAGSVNVPAADDGARPGSPISSRPQEMACWRSCSSSLSQSLDFLSSPWSAAISPISSWSRTRVASSSSRAADSFNGSICSLSMAWASLSTSRREKPPASRSSSRRSRTGARLPSCLRITFVFSTSALSTRSSSRWR